MHLDSGRYERNRLIRSASTQRVRNPITEGDEPSIRFAQKGQVPHYLTATRRLNDRPKGLGQGYFSSKNQGTFKFAVDPAPLFKPSRRHIEVELSGNIPDSSKKIVRPSTPIRNPVIQDASFDSPTRFSKKVSYQPQNRPDPPRSITPRKQESYAKRNTSNIFTPERSFESSKKVAPVKVSNMGSILTYQYALPYRETKITNKLV